MGTAIKAIHMDLHFFSSAVLQTRNDTDNVIVTYRDCSHLGTVLPDSGEILAPALLIRLQWTA